MSETKNIEFARADTATLEMRPADAHRLWHLNSAFSWALFDAVAAVVCMLVAFALSPVAAPVGSAGENHLNRTVACSVAAGVAVVLSFALGLNYHVNIRSRGQLVVLVALLALCTVTVTTSLAAFVLFKQMGRYILGIFTGLYFLVQCAARLAWYARIRNAVHRVAVLATSQSTLAATLDRLAEGAAFRLIFHHLPVPTTADARVIDAFPQAEIHEIVIDPGKGADDAALLRAASRGLSVCTADAFAERHFLKVPVSLVTPNWFYQLDLKHHHPLYASGKRVLDVCLAVSVGLLTLPIIGLAAVSILMGSGRPVLYSQVRVGLNQRPFRIWKLRTMRLNSEQEGPKWAAVNDQRITVIGRILRKTRIDELPQVWNIFIGDMSFVGPRPERPEFVAMLSEQIPYYEQRHLVKPGLTGWAQINYQYGASVADAREKLAYDLYYLKNASALLDMQVILQTLGAVAKGSR